MPIKCVCKTCEKIFYKPTSTVKAGRGRYCSKICLYQATSKRLKGKKSTRRYATGADSATWKGKSAPKECPVCRKIFKKSTVHCSPKCGQVTRSSKIRGSNNPFSKKNPAEIKICKTCGKKFSRCVELTGNYKAGKLYCSYECHRKQSHRSRNQSIIADELVKVGFKIEQEKKFTWLVNPRTNRMLRIDIYLSTENVAIEYDGRQHYQKAFSKNDTEFEKIQFRDKIKNEKLEERGIRLIRLRGWPVNLEELVQNIRSIK